MGRVEILYKSDGTSKRNPYPFVLLYWMHHADWPHRIRRSRGWLQYQQILTREMTEQEQEECKKSHRAISYRYKNAQQLIDDEIKILGKEHPAVKELITKFCPDYSEEENKAETVQLSLFKPE